MAAIEDELKKLEAEQKSADLGVKAAASALLKSQSELNEAKARESAVTERLAPLQLLARELESSSEAGKKQRESAAREIDEAKKFFANVFPAVSKEITKEARDALDKAEAARAKSEETLQALRQEIAKSEKEQTAARENAASAEMRVRELVAERGGLANRIEAARGAVAQRLAAARGAFAAGKVGETFLALRELDAARAELVKAAEENADTELLKSIDAARAQANEANAKATSHTPVLNTLKEKLSAAEQDLQGKDQAAKEARAAVTAPART